MLEIHANIINYETKEIKETRKLYMYSYWDADIDAFNFEVLDNEHNNPEWSGLPIADELAKCAEHLDTMAGIYFNGESKQNQDDDTFISYNNYFKILDYGISDDGKIVINAAPIHVLIVMTEEIPRQGFGGEKRIMAEKPEKSYF